MTDDKTGAPPLPQPTRDRWTPLRMGLVELFYYDQEQFWFHDGRLLLRGNNGTGKSKVLALTLPFLLDGNLDPRRVEPDADRGKRMEWNLLLGDSDSYEDRTGYAWLEFGRFDAITGSAEFCTLGCGMKAVRGRGIARHWFFITPRRIGDLTLVDDTKVVLTMDRLRDQFADDEQSRIYERAEEYRRAVDERLFGFGAERYGTLIDLLIQLRQPQLSRKPNEKALAQALTESLPPLGADVLSDIAEALRSLDEDRRHVEELKLTQQATEQFLGAYRRYARVQSRLVAGLARQTNSSYEELGRQLILAEQALQQAQAETDRLDDAARQAGLDLVQLDARREALRDSEVWGDASNLDQARLAANDAHDRLAQTYAALQEALERVELASEQADTDMALAGDGEAAAALADEEARGGAAAAGLSATHGDALASRAEAAKSLARRREQVDRVAMAVEAAAAARAQADKLRQRAADAETEATDRNRLRLEADAVVEAATDTLVAAVRSFVATLTWLTPPDPEALADAVEAWAADPDWDFPVTVELARLADDALMELAAKAQAISGSREQTQAELDDELAALDELLAGASPIPVPRPTRRDLSDDARPFYSLVDFADHVPPEDRAGIEAALEASGLLDAAVRPNGSVTNPVTGDLLLGAAIGEMPPWPTLDGPLVPDEQSDAPDLIRCVLRGIGLGPESGPVWIDAAGRFALGPAYGAWAKPEAEFMGATARERARQARIASLQAHVTELKEALARLDDDREAIETQMRQVRGERDSVPTREPQAVIEALRAARTAAAEEVRANQRAAAASAIATEAQLSAQQSESEAAEIGATLKVTATPAGVGETRRLVDRYENLLTEARAKAELAAQARATATRAQRELDQRVTDKTAREEAYARDEAADLVAAERHATLQSSVGAAVEQLQAEMSQLDAERKLAHDRIDSLGQQRRAADQSLGVAKEKLDQLKSEREEAAVRREQALQRFREFAALSLFRIAVPQADTSSLESTTAAVGLARQAEAALAGESIEDDAVIAAKQRSSRALTDLRSELSAYHHSVETIEHRDGEEVVIRYNDREMDPAGLMALLADLISGQQQLLSAREREILENYLMTDTASRLSELLVRSASWVDELNRELQLRATSTGMKLRLRWIPADDAPAGFDQVRELMLRSGALWDEKERGLIGAFLQRGIQTQRDLDPAAGWDAQLAQAFDYRRWHTFVIERFQSQRWVPSVGPASSGERALGLTIPQFAAAASFYGTAANKSAPRLILLDEAFVGIDDDARSKAMGLFAAFDLDVVMTSEREWGCYESVPGLAIAQLSRSDGVLAVHVDRWEWNGAAREHVEDPGDEALAWHE